MGNDLIRLNDVRKTYPAETGAVTPLREVSAAVPEGRFVVVTGPSGTGKSTLFRLLNRLEDPDQGTITYRGEDLTDWDPVRLRRQVHYVHQNPILFRKTVADNLCYPLALQGKKLAEGEMVRLLTRVVSGKTTSTAPSKGCPAARNSGSTWPAPSPSTRPSSCWMSPLPPWTKHRRRRWRRNSAVFTRRGAPS